MATVLGMISTRLKDAEGIITNHEEFVSFADTHTIADIQAFADAYMAVLDAITEAQPIQQTFRIILGLDGAKIAPVGDSDIQETLLMSYLVTGAAYKWGDDVGAYIDAINVGGRIDVANADLAAYSAFQTSAHSGFTPATRYGDTLDTLYSAMETFRTKRRALNAASRTLT
jgi:hypothetical protein